MNGEINIAGIRNLAVLGKRSKISRLRAIRNEIEKVLTAGVSLDRVVSELNGQGMELSLATFKMMLYRLRKESKTAATEIAIGHGNGVSDDTVHLLQGNADTPRIFPSKENVVTNAGVVLSISKSLTPGEPKKFNWEELKKIESNWN